jgi:hypothetical protein
MPAMTAVFVPGPAGSLEVFVSGSFPSRALYLTARVGDVAVERVSVGPNGDAFWGVLRRAPAAGAKLYVRYPPGPEVETAVRYTPPSPNQLPVA